MSDSKIIRFGSTGVNLASVVSMSEEEFKNIFRSVLIDYDIDEAWKEVKKHQPKQTKTTSKKATKKIKYANPDE